MAEWLTSNVIIALSAALSMPPSLHDDMATPRPNIVKKIPWWETYAARVPVDEFRDKFRMWPSTLCNLVNRLSGSHFSVDRDESWAICVATDEAKYIAHSACLMIHGK